MALDIKEGPNVHQVTAAASDHPVQRLHPAIYLMATGLAILFAASFWGFFAPQSRNYLLAVATGFVFLAVFLPFQLWRVRRHGREFSHDIRDSSLSPRSFGDWLRSDLEVWGSRLRGKDAAVAILLPMAAGAFGMLLLAIELHVAVG